MEIETIDLFEKTVFTRVSFSELVQMPTPMPDNEAGFVYVLKGRCLNHTETDLLDIKNNQAVLAKSGNSIFKTLTHNNSDNYEAISIRFHKDILSKIYINEQSSFFEQSKTPLNTNSVSIKNHPLIDEYIQSIIPYFNNKNLLNDDLLILKIKELITLLLHTKSSPRVIEIMSNLFEEKTFEFRTIINAHIFSSITIKELAQLTHMSLSSFKKEFKRIFNDTPQKYIINKRIEKVAETLQYSSKSLSNIAYDCQFSTLAHMSRVFKQKYGISPSQYKENLLDK